MNAIAVRLNQTTSARRRTRLAREARPVRVSPPKRWWPDSSSATADWTAYRLAPRA